LRNNIKRFLGNESLLAKAIMVFGIQWYQFHDAAARYSMCKEKRSVVYMADYLCLSPLHTTL